MQQYKEFIFESYTWDASTSTAKFQYSFDGDAQFTETITWPSATHTYNVKQLDAALFALHVAIGISYFKAYLPPKISIKSGKLHKSQAEFWNTVYTEGLGEFWYTNQLDWHDRIHFPFSEIRNVKCEMSSLDCARDNNLESTHLESRISNPLVPIGGGKDSLVTIEALKKAGITPTLFRIGNHPLIQKQAEIAECPLHVIERQFDLSLMEHNKAGAYNGHVPITLIVSLIAVVDAILHNHDAVVFSNEHSASFGNVEYLGMEVNHQWSKSFKAEQLLQGYILNYISPTMQYISLLRPLSEIAIAKEFTTHHKYFKWSTSCNANWRIWREQPTELWSTDSKSAFVFALYSAYLDEKTILNIFNINLFDEQSTVDTYRELLGLQGIKPLECVGTPNETLYAFYKCHQEGKWANTHVMNMFEADVLPNIQNIEAIERELFTMNSNHNLTPELLQIISHIPHETC